MRHRLLFCTTVCALAGALFVACVGSDPALSATAPDCTSPNGCLDDGGANPDGPSTTVDTGVPGTDAGPDGCSGPCNGELVWLRGVGSTGGDQVLETVVDATGNIYLLANAGGALSLGDDGGPPTISAPATFVAKLDANGKALWAKALGGNTLQPHLAVNADGNVFIAGTYFKNSFQTLPITWDGSDTGLPANVGTSGYDIFVLAVDSAGAQRSVVQIGAPSYDELNAIGVDHDGSPVIFGKMAAAVTYQGQAIPMGPFVLEMNANLAPHWVHPIGIRNAGFAVGTSIIPMQDGDLAVTGTSGGEVAFDGTFSGSSAAPVATDTFVARLKSADGTLLGGNQNFIELYGDSSLPTAAETRVSSIAFGGPAASLGIVGQFHGWVGLGSTTPFLTAGGGITTRDPGTYVAVFSAASLLPLGYRAIADGTSPDLKRMTVDKSGLISLAGAFTDTVDYGGGPLVSAGAEDGVVALYDATLKTTLWSKRFGGPVSDRVVGTGVDADGGVVVVGEFQATADFPGGKQLTSQAGQTNIFLMKLAR